MRARIIGTGSCLPATIVTNDDLSKIMDTSDEWISSRTGIRERHLVKEETTAGMSAEAARRAMEDAGVTAEEISRVRGDASPQEIVDIAAANSRRLFRLI